MNPLSNYWKYLTTELTDMYIFHLTLKREDVKCMPLINSPRQNETFRILVIDDEPDIAQSIRSVLEKRYDVDMITDPRKALDNFKAGSYDLVLLDYRMPNVNGFQLYRYLERVDPAQTICFMTAYE